MDMQQLIADLHKDDDEARWKATRDLSRRGARAVDPVLEDLCHSQLGERLCRAYLFILEHQRARLTSARVRPVVEALRGPAPRVQAPVMAERALQQHTRTAVRT